MSGVSAKCYGTKWRLRRGSNPNDVDDQKSRQSKPSYRPNVRASDRAFCLWFVFARGFYAQSPVSEALPYVLLSRNLLYTGLTRAKQLAILVGPTKAIELAIKRVTDRQRYTALADRLKVLSGHQVGCGIQRVRLNVQPWCSLLPLNAQASNA